MRQWDQVNAVQRMQDHIKENIENADFCMEGVYASSGYSKRHAVRIFKELLEKTPEEYVRAVRLSKSSEELLLGAQTILDVALAASFDSHEGYTRAFRETYRITPSDYRKRPTPIPRFVQYPIRDYYIFLKRREEKKMEKETLLCTVSVVSRPKRKLMVLRCSKGTDYFSFCEEMGCEWEGLFNSIPEKMDSAAIVELPPKFAQEGKTLVGAGVEVPFDYDRIPEGYELIELEPCDMLYFQSAPFEKEEEFCEAIDSVAKAIETYTPAAYGYEYDFSLAPSFNFGASAELGAKQAVPARKITK